MTRDEIQELIDSHGADAARWPDAVRAEATATIAGDVQLQAAQREAASLDALLDGWARRLPVTETAGVAARILKPAVRWPRFAGAGLMAAAVAAVVFVIPLGSAPIAPVISAAVATDADDAAAFETLFTPTPDEESLI